MSVSVTSFGYASGYEYAYRHQTANALTVVALCVTSRTTAHTDEWWIAYPLALYVSLACIVAGAVVRAWGATTASVVVTPEDAAAARAGAVADDVSDVAVFSPTQKAPALVTTGAYSVVRHPLYLGSCLLTAAFGVLMNAWGLLTLVALHAVRVARLMAYEDARLHQRFGTAWRTYRDATPNALCPVPLPPGVDASRLLASVTGKGVSEWVYGFRANAIAVLPLIAVAVGGAYWPTGTYVWAVVLMLSALDALELVKVQVTSKRHANANANANANTKPARASSTPTPANSLASNDTGDDDAAPATATGARAKAKKNRVMT